MLVIQPRHFVTSMDCSPPGSPVHGILQAILKWVAIPFSRGYSRPRDPPGSPASRFFPIWATKDANTHWLQIFLTAFTPIGYLTACFQTSLILPGKPHSNWNVSHRFSIPGHYPHCYMSGRALFSPLQASIHLFKNNKWKSGYQSKM